MSDYISCKIIPWRWKERYSFYKNKTILSKFSKLIGEKYTRQLTADWGNLIGETRSKYWKNNNKFTQNNCEIT